MKISRLFVLVTFFVFFLPSCHPSYTLEQTEFYARKIGVTKQFDIHRRSTRVIAVSSRLCVISENKKNVDMSALSKVIASGLSPFFQEVSALENTDTIESAVTIADNNNTDFVVYIRLLDSGELLKDDSPSASSNYYHLRLLLVVVNANSSEVMDKIQLLAKSSHFSLLGDDMSSLLAKPLEYIAHDLSGV